MNEGLMQFVRLIRSRVTRNVQAFLNALLDWVDRQTEYQPRPGEARANDRTGLAFVGCGFVADFYVATLPLHPELELIGVMDRNESRARKFAARHGVKFYPSLDALLSDPAVQVVVNLTNPESHFEVSKASLEAGKHVYSEKPLAMKLDEAETLVTMAGSKGLVLSCAPCSILGESAQALAKALSAREIGQVRLVYAELDDGPIHQMHPEEWASPLGTPWPWRNEFSIGCTIEHACYHLSWLVAFFGPAASVTAFSAPVISDKHPALPASEVGPDFSVACIVFHSGVIARLTCSIVAPHDHAFRIIGDKGVLHVDECWHFRTPVWIRRFTGLRFRAESYPWLRRSAIWRALYGLDGKVWEKSPNPDWRGRLRRHEMDYLTRVSELAASLREHRPCRLSAEFALHVTEIALAIQNARETGSSKVLKPTSIATHAELFP